MDVYEGLGEIMGDLEFAELRLREMVQNGHNDKAVRYLGEAALEIRHALSDLSDALFEITTSPMELIDDEFDDVDPL